jgi:maltose alpha-D-glucosyltransferase/alpha-amylase
VTNAQHDTSSSDAAAREPAADYPVLTVAGGLETALAPATLGALSDAPLARFLSQRRWFGAKGERIVSARFDAVIPVQALGHAAALTRVTVRFESGPSAVYQLPLIAAPASEGTGERDAMLARVETPDGRVLGALVDATADAGFRSWLGNALETGDTIARGESRWMAQPVAGAADAPEPMPQSRVIASEQSNTSIVYGERAILKLFRRLEPGENPDVEISRFLTTRTQFRNTPLLLGVAHIEHEAEEDLEPETAVTGMLQRFVAGASDAFEYAVDRAGDAISADAMDGVVPFAGDARRLGCITRELHTALASSTDDPAFVPKPAGRDAVARWRDGAMRSVDAACDLLARRLADASIPQPLHPLAHSLTSGRAAIAVRLDDLAAAVGDAGMLVRHHGDYHLGQVLRTPDGDFIIIDFEGEPARSIPERRARNSALRDVAGMLRSFGYAAAMAAPTNERWSGSEIAARRASWERQVRDAFLHGYFADARSAYLPRDRADSDRLVTLFEIEKVFYELVYELNNRPSWVGVPLAGAARCLGIASLESAG